MPQLFIQNYGASQSSGLQSAPEIETEDSILHKFIENRKQHQLRKSKAQDMESKKVISIGENIVPASNHESQGTLVTSSQFEKTPVESYRD